MLPKKIYLNYVDENDEDTTWSEEPVSGYDCKMKNREYTDLSQVWHDASEEPQEYPILCKDEFSNTWLEYNLNDYVDGWVEYVEFHELIQWAYISDLLPKQFGNSKQLKGE